MHPEHLNTPRQVYDDQQQLRWRWDQTEPFGVNSADENPVNLGAFDLPLRFPGQYSDKETNTSYNYFRDYDPAIARYATSDPIGLRGGTNTYLYVDGSPTDLVDPEGNFGVLGALGGAGMSITTQMSICASFGGNLSTCVRCLNVADIAINAAVGAVFPTWFGNVATKAGANLLKGSKILNASVLKNAKGAAAGTAAATVSKAVLPNSQISCNDDCAPYRVGGVLGGISTSVF